MIQLGDNVTRDFCTRNPVSGQVADADFLPTCAIFQGTNDTPVMSPTVVKRTGLTGDYRVTFSVTTANGFVAGNSYNVVVTATVGGVMDKAPIASFVLPARSRAIVL